MLVSRADVYKAIYETIDNELSIEVYENLGPQDAQLPIAVYSGIGDVPLYHMADESLDLDFQVSFFGQRNLGVQVLREYADTLITALDRDKGKINITGYDNEIVHITEGGVVTVENNILHLRLGFRLRGF